jgi:ParB/RepB/Spo0J family partition protein
MDIVGTKPAAEENVSAGGNEIISFGAGDYRLVELHLSTISLEAQIRKEYNQEGISELAESIKSQGLINPIEVKKSGEKYRIISGHRRFLAAKKLGWEKIPANIKMGVKEKDIPIRQLIENIQRENLNPVEEAMAMQYIIKKNSLTQQKLGEILGKSKSRISNTLSILKLLKKVSHAKLNRISKDSLIALSYITSEPFFDEVFERAREGYSRPELNTLITAFREGKSLKYKRREIRKKNIEDKVKEIFSAMQELNEKVMKFKIKFGRELSDDLEEGISAQLKDETQNFLSLISTLFTGKATIDVNVTVTKPKEIEFPGTSTTVQLSPKLKSVSYSFIVFESSKKKAITLIKEKLPDIEESILEETEKSVLIDQWNALPFQTIKKNVDGFFYKALKDLYKLPKEYMELKEKSSGKTKTVPKTDLQRKEKIEQYNFE